MNTPALGLPLPSLDPAQARRALQGLPIALALVGADWRLGWRNARFDALFDEPALDVERLTAAAEGQKNGVPARVRSRAGGVIDVRVANLSCGLGRMLALDDGPAARVPGLEARLAELEAHMMVDPVTGAWNRRYLDRIITTEIIRSRRYRHPLSAAIVALDRRGADVPGGAAGHALARRLAQLVSATVRMADTVCTWGDGGLLVLMPYATHRGARIAGERVRAAIASHPLGDAGTVTASVGVAELASGDTGPGLFARACDMLRVATDAGGNQVACEALGASEEWAHDVALAPVNLAWNEAYACGNAGLDAGRREIFRLGNVLLCAGVRGTNGDLAAALERCVAHLGIHFEREENVLAERGYASLARHHDMHQALLARAQDIGARARAGEPVTGELLEFLCRDLVAQHLLAEDRDYLALTEYPGPRDGR